MSMKTDEQLTAIIESMPIAIILVDEQGNIQAINNQTEKLFGYSKPELIGQSIELLVPARARLQHSERRAMYAKSPQARPMGMGRDLFALHKNGTEFPVEIGLNPIQTDKGVFIVSTIIDITERKRQTEVLMRSNEVLERSNIDLQRFAYLASHDLQTPMRASASVLELFFSKYGDSLTPEGRAWVERSLLRSNEALERSNLEIQRFAYLASIESMPIAIVLVDEQGNIQAINNQTEKLFGYSKPELVGKSIEILVPGRSRLQHSELRAMYAKSPQTRPMGMGRDLFAMRKNGTEFPVEIGLNPVQTDKGVFVVSTIIDITERKRQEEVLMRSNEVLERSNIELQRFVYIASHDLQTPMRTIASFLELFSSKYGDGLTPEGRDWIERSLRAVKQLQILVQDLLEYSRLESKTRPFERVAFRDVLNHAIALLSAPINETHAKITAEEELPVVMGDRSQLVQLMQNLIGNSLKYCKKVPPQIHVSAKRQDKAWLFSVSDNGIGIESEYYEKIFEIFQRLHDQSEYPGTGIGLAVCRRVVSSHGGRIWVESEPGRGSVFYFTISDQAENIV